MFKWLFGERGVVHRTHVNDETAASAIADHLIEMGYLKYVPLAQRDAVRGDLVRHLRDGHLDARHDWYSDARDRRGYSADAEDLAEGDVGGTIKRMREVLRAEGVPITRVADHPEDADGAYSVEIDGRHHVVWTMDDAEHDGDAWDLATRHLLDIVNQLLRDAGSPEHLYSIYGGHHGRVILLTDEMHAYLSSLGPAIDARWMPVSAEQVHG